MTPADLNALETARWSLGHCVLFRHLEAAYEQDKESPPNVIRQAAWLYFRFTLGFRDGEDLL